MAYIEYDPNLGYEEGLGGEEDGAAGGQDDDAGRYPGDVDNRGGGRHEGGGRCDDASCPYLCNEEGEQEGWQGVSPVEVDPLDCSEEFLEAAVDPADMLEVQYGGGIGHPMDEEEVQDDEYGYEDYHQPAPSPRPQVAKRGRGRPRKDAVWPPPEQQYYQGHMMDPDAPSPAKRGRGRPRKDGTVGPRRPRPRGGRRGRPPKYAEAPLNQEALLAQQGLLGEHFASPVRRGPGRPRKEDYFTAADGSLMLVGGNNRSLRRRQAREGGGLGSTCPFCRVFVVSVDHLRSHLESAHSRKMRCGQCNFKTPFQLSMDNHRFSKHGLGLGRVPIRCPFCPYNVFQWGRMFDHLKEHEGDEPVAVPPPPTEEEDGGGANGEGPSVRLPGGVTLSWAGNNGGGDYSQDDSYEDDHYHSPDWPAAAPQMTARRGRGRPPVARRGRGRGSGLSILPLPPPMAPMPAVKKFKSRVPERTICSLCETRFSTAAELRQHMNERYFAGPPPFRCPACDFSTTIKMNLPQHYDICHRKIADYECAECDFKTHAKPYLRNHEKATHEGWEKPKNMRCPLCPYRTNTRYCLTDHIKRRHRSGQRPEASPSTSLPPPPSHHFVIENSNAEEDDDGVGDVKKEDMDSDAVTVKVEPEEVEEEEYGNGGYGDGEEGNEDSWAGCEDGVPPATVKVEPGEEEDDEEMDGEDSEALQDEEEEAEDGHVVVEPVIEQDSELEEANEEENSNGVAVQPDGYLEEESKASQDEESGGAQDEASPKSEHLHEEESESLQKAPSEHGESQPLLVEAVCSMAENESSDSAEAHHETQSRSVTVVISKVSGSQQGSDAAGSGPGPNKNGGSVTLTPVSKAGGSEACADQESAEPSLPIDAGTSAEPAVPVPSSSIDVGECVETGVPAPSFSIDLGKCHESADPTAPSQVQAPEPSKERSVAEADDGGT